MLRKWIRLIQDIYNLSLSSSVDNHVISIPAMYCLSTKNKNKNISKFFSWNKKYGKKTVIDHSLTYLFYVVVSATECRETITRHQHFRSSISWDTRSAGNVTPVCRILCECIWFCNYIVVIAEFIVCLVTSLLYLWPVRFFKCDRTVY